MGLQVGLDIGIASVGWCAADTTKNRIVGIGVRTFPRAEDPQTGASLAGPRRLARSARRRLKRRRQRMIALRDLLLSSNIVTEKEMTAAFQMSSETKTPYDLRAEGLDRLFSGTEWARVLTQMCKRRGYKSMRLSAEKDKDEGVVKEAIAANKALMQTKGYRTTGEMFARDERFEQAKRNRRDYKNMVSRELLLDEIRTLFATQRAFGNPGATENIEQAYLDIVSSQASIKEGAQLTDLVGVCSLDRTNKRIPAACPTFEHFRFIDKLHNVRYWTDGGCEKRTLSEDERRKIMEKAFSKTSSAVTYADIRKICGMSADVRFVSVRYNSTNPDDLSAETKEKLPFPKAWHSMRKQVESVSKQAWTGLAHRPAVLDQVAHILTYFKYDESIRRELRILTLSGDVAAALAELRFSGHGHLSRETLVAILPHMESGLSYSDACEAAGFHHSQLPEGVRSQKLPAIPADEIRNPVVVRALSQSRKVLNAIIDRYGPIEELHIELGRDVARTYDDRRKIEKRQKDNRAINDSVIEAIEKDFGLENPRPHDIVKFKLWKEQNGRCAYSGAYIDARKMLYEPGVAEVDHILPHSRSFDDSYMNKVLATWTENQRKGQRTPFEYLGGDPQRWHAFEEHVHAMHLPQPKQERLLRSDFDERTENEFRERNLVDTRYITRFFKNFVEQRLEFSGDKKRPVLTINGRATAYLRSAWRLQKIRSDGDLHHALDAAVIAVADQSMVQKISNFFASREMRKSGETYYDPSTGEIIESKEVPEPWEGFREELETLLTARFGEDPPAELATASAAGDLRPILVSRMPNRTCRGPVHKDTVRRIEGVDSSGRIITSTSVLLKDLKEPKQFQRLLDNMVGRKRDPLLYEALKTRIDEFKDKPKETFAEPLFKPNKSGLPGPEVSAVRVFDDAASGGVNVRGGLADNGRMIRTDVFEKDGKFYLVPVYVRDVAAKALPNRAVIAYKAQSEWRVMDDSFRFRFSLYMNDLVRLIKRVRGDVQSYFGYFKGVNISTGAITIDAHDGSESYSSLGVAQSVLSFEKFHADILGQRAFPIRREKRVGFSDGRHIE